MTEQLGLFDGDDERPVYGPPEPWALASGEATGPTEMPQGFLLDGTESDEVDSDNEDRDDEDRDNEDRDNEDLDDAWLIPVEDLHEDTHGELHEDLADTVAPTIAEQLDDELDHDLQHQLYGSETYDADEIERVVTGLDRDAEARRQDRMRRAQEAGEDITVVRPQLFGSSMAGMSKISPRRRRRLLIMAVFAAALMYLTLRCGPDDVKWSAHANLEATVTEVQKLPTLGLPLQTASAENLSDVNKQRREAEARGEDISGGVLAEKVIYVGAFQESKEGSVSVFASPTLWAAASVEPDGTCLWALVAPSSWAAVFNPGSTLPCKAESVVTAAPQLLSGK